MSDRPKDNPTNEFIEEAIKRSGTVIFTAKDIKKTTLDRFLTADRGVKLDQN